MQQTQTGPSSTFLPGALTRSGPDALLHHAESGRQKSLGSSSLLSNSELAGESVKYAATAWEKNMETSSFFLV